MKMKKNSITFAVHKVPTESTTTEIICDDTKETKKRRLLDMNLIYTRERERKESKKKIS